MADIKQAAIWLQKGKKVHRKSICGFWSATYFASYLQYSDDYGREQTDMLSVIDLLAEDWELYEEREI